MKTVRMLVIDNSIFFRKELSAAMCRQLPAGSLVETAADAIEAMEKIRLFAPSVVVVNVALSAITIEGKHLFPALTEKIQAPIIAYGILPEARSAALKSGAAEYVVKPSDSGDMAAFFRRIVSLADRPAPNKAVAMTTDKPAAAKLQPGAIMTRAGWQAAHAGHSVGYTAKPVPQVPPLHASPSSVAATAHTHHTGSVTLPGSVHPHTTTASAPHNAAWPSTLHHNAATAVKPHESKSAFPTPALHTVAQTAPPAAHLPPSAPHGKINLIAVGSSTGGTEALSAVFKNLRPPLPGIVVTQHIPALFATLFADRLNHECALTVKEGEDGETVQRNTIYIAPGNKHMTIGRGAGGYVIKIGMGPKVHSCRPSVDVLFKSVAEVAGSSALGVILTGMGQDGAEGLLKMRQQGSPTLGQDEATCIVYGMPRAAWEMGAVEKQLPLNMIADAITQIARA